jgi:hypothetical protein
MPIINGSTESVQVGDFGIGFLNEYGLVDTLHADKRHKFIRGNHDDPALCKERPGYIADGTYDERGILYVGGAWSIDWKFRTPGYTWWPEEELNTPELARMHELYVHHKPRIMVTHDAPTSVSFDMFIRGTQKIWHKTRTAEALEGMFLRHRPETWIFGHWHEDRDEVINGTRFICLGINSFIDLKV